MKGPIGATQYFFAHTQTLYNYASLHGHYVQIIMPRCACASEVYGSVFVCLCVCLSV